MGNGIPVSLPAPDSRYLQAQDILDRLETAMLEQQKKELNAGMLEGAIEIAEEAGYNRTNTALVARAEYLLSLVKHQFADVRVAEYKKKWEWEEALKDPQGELMQRLVAERDTEDVKASKRKKPVKFYNKPVENKPDCTVAVSNLSKCTTESMLRAHLDEVPDMDWEDPKTKRKKKPSEEPMRRRCGNFIRCHIARNANGDCEGVAYLEYSDDKQLAHAMLCDGSVMDCDKIAEKAREYCVDEKRSMQVSRV